MQKVIDQLDTQRLNIQGARKHLFHRVMDSDRGCTIDLGGDVESEEDEEQSAIDSGSEDDTSPVSSFWAPD